MLPILTLLHLFPLSTAHPQSTLGNRNFPDLSITYDPSTDKWYAFATQSDDGIHVQVASSSSFPSGSDWTYLPRTDILPVPGKWVNSSHPEIWAPDVHFVNSSSSGKWVMYYSGLASGSGYHCIGTASTASTSSNASILGPYTADDEPFACPTSMGGAIDASGFYDKQDDARWVVYKVDGSAKGPGGPCGNGLPPGEPTPFMLQRVDARDGVTKVGEPIEILDRDPELDGPLIEAPSLVKHVVRGGGDDDDDDNNDDDHGRGGDRWVLFYSSHCFNSEEYDVRYAVSESGVEGPYKRMGQLIGKDNGSYYDGLVAPGGASVIAQAHGGINRNHGKGPGAMVFHADCPAGRCMYQAEWVIGDDGVVDVVRR